MTVRVSTPPRVITLSEHHFPSASDEPQFSPEQGDGDYNRNEYESNDNRIAAKPRKLYTQDMNQR